VTPANTAPAQRDTKPSFFKRLLAHQESGLVLVIILMMALLTLYGMFTPPIEQKTRIQLEENATIYRLDADGNEHEHLAANQIVGYRVVVNGETREYSSANIERYDSSARTLIQVNTVNRFLNKSNLVLIAKDASFFAIIAVGMTGVIILAGIDLSVGSIYGLSAIVGAMVLSNLPAETGWIVAVPLALIVCTAVGTACGLANGAMSEGLGVHPFVITLGMMAALRGLTVVIPQQFFGTQSIGGFPTSFTTGFFKAEFNGVYPVPVILMLLCGIAGWFILSKTVFGRRIFAIGGNETAAKYAGIPVKRVKILVYTITGALCGLSACAYLGYYGAAETNAGNAYELQVIAATVIGGASLMGGRGTVIGAVLGAIIIQLINNTLIIFEVDTSYNQIVMGAAIIIAVVIDQTKQRIQARRA